MASTSRAVPSRPTKPGPGLVRTGTAGFQHRHCKAGGKPGPAPTAPARAALVAAAAAGTDRFWGHVLPVRVPGLIAFIRNQGRMPRKVFREQPQSASRRDQLIGPFHLERQDRLLYHEFPLLVEVLHPSGEGFCSTKTLHQEGLRRK